MGSRIRLMQAAISAAPFTGKLILSKHHFSAYKIGIILKIYKIYTFSA